MKLKKKTKEKHITLFQLIVFYQCRYINLVTPFSVLLIR